MKRILFILTAALASMTVMAQRTIYVWEGAVCRTIVADSVTFMSPEPNLYISGAACGINGIYERGMFAQGINEAGMETREGLYDKYVYLDANKDFEFIYGSLRGNKRHYGAWLESGEIPTDFYDVSGYTGAITENMKMQVKESGLYHVIVDMNINNDYLPYAKAILMKVEWGIAGGMTSWGYLAADSEQFYFNDGQQKALWTWKNVEVGSSTEFKFKHNKAWKFYIDNAYLISINTNLGKDANGGVGVSTENLLIDKPGIYNISLEYNLAGGDISNSFTYRTELIKEFDPVPSVMYMIGDVFGGWDWNSDGVIEMTPVHSHPGMFWTTQYISANDQFKFSPQRAWNGDFYQLQNNEGFSTYDTNCKVEKDGFYTVLIDYKNSSITIYPAEIYGMGEAFGSWEEGKYPFVQDLMGKVMTAKTSFSGELRMYSRIRGNDGNWWQSEFQIYNGKIVYRGTAGDQERVQVEAGKTITLDFNKGTGKVE